MSKRGVTKPRRSQNMMIKVPGKPKRVYGVSELSLKIAKEKQAIERAREKRELENELKEVWE